MRWVLVAALGDAETIARGILRFRGIVLDSVIEDYHEPSQKAEVRKLVGEIQSRRRQLQELDVLMPKAMNRPALNSRSDARLRLNDDLERLEASLARIFASSGKVRRALTLDVDEVRGALPNNGVLIQFLHYEYSGRANYGAIILGATARTRWIPLGEAKEIDSIIADVGQGVRGKTKERALEEMLHLLYHRLWEPVESELPSGTQNVVIEPDGSTYFVAFASLLKNDGRFVAEDYNICYVSSGRDLLLANASPVNREIVIYAFPKYGELPPPSGDMLSYGLPSMRDFSQLRFNALPQTKAEAQKLQDLALRRGYKVTAWFTNEASEARIQREQSPYILHLATHGFFLSDNTGSDEGLPFRVEHLALGPKTRFKNPMKQSGIALAGAQKTIEAWSRGIATKADNDGIVTAEEVAGLNLRGTTLVTLSACDTGIGFARSGEGLFGLRRGFAISGAQNTLMTLWPIASDETVDFMVAFYDNFLETADASGSLAKVQRERLIDLRRKRGAANAARIAGPFVLCAQRSLK